LTQCQAETGFANITKEGFPPLLCEEVATDSGFCIFHDKKYLKDEANSEPRKKEVTSRLMQKIKEFTNNKIRDNREYLVCNGYNLPDITIKEYFTNQVFFLNCHFHGTANFSGSIFESNANFGGSTFYQNTSFYRVGFVNPTSFSSVQFLKDTNFAYSIFNSDTYFLGAIFSGQVTFENTQFLGDTFFDKARFIDKTDFSKTEFGGKTRFKYSIFEANERVLFDVKTLSKVSFTDADITRVTFGEEVIWGR
jgi:uncharacterized protein YjbI with pentapeptide repeats